MNKYRITLGVYLMTVLSVSCGSASGAMIWDWATSDGFGGTFSTDGTFPTVSQTYHLTGFELTATVDAVNFPLGSIETGEYAEGFTIVEAPGVQATFGWDATLQAPTGWGTYANRLAIIESTADVKYIFNFGVSPQGFPGATQVGLFKGGLPIGLGGAHNLTPVPEPSSIILSILAIVAMATVSRRGRVVLRSDYSRSFATAIEDFVHSEQNMVEWKANKKPNGNKNTRIRA